MGKPKKVEAGITTTSTKKEPARGFIRRTTGEIHEVNPFGIQNCNTFVRFYGPETGMKLSDFRHPYLDQLVVQHYGGFSLYR